MGFRDLRDVYVRKTYTVTENQTESRIPISRNGGGGGGHTSPISVVSSTGPLPIGTSASSATKELDDLMASLSDFKVS